MAALPGEGGHSFGYGVEGNAMKRVWAGLALTALLLAGCGNNEAEANVQRFCELIEQYNKGTGFQAPPDDTPEDQRDAALTKAMRDYLSLPEIKAILEELGEVAPPEVDAEVDTMRKAADELVATGESTFTETEAVEANDKIKSYTDTACAPESEAPAEDDEATEG